LDSGKLSGATLDVFRVEPLPANDPYWIHPKVLVTPHIASETRLETSAAVVVENIERGEAGQSFLHLVDRKVGY
jgi:glyoxylate/hydroxypyruvate reductase A